MSEDKCTKCNSVEITFLEWTNNHSAYKCKKCSNVFAL